MNSPVPKSSSDAGSGTAAPAVGDLSRESAATHEHSTSVDVARGLQAGCPRQVGSGRADRTLRDPHVERIDRRKGDVDQLFAGTRLRIGDLVELEGATDGMKSGCAHRATVGPSIVARPSR
jgi:hypothetical protein